MDLRGNGPDRTWTQPEVAGLGRLPSRATLHPYPDVAAALVGDRRASPWFLSLNGDWRFHLAPRPEAALSTFADPACDDRG